VEEETPRTSTCTKTNETLWRDCGYGSLNGIAFSPVVNFLPEFRKPPRRT